MRLARAALIGLVVVGVAVLVAEPLLHGSMTCTSVLLTPRASFVGSVVAKDGPKVTFEIVSLEPARAANDAALRPGEQVTVSYDGGDERFVHEDHRYLVDAYGNVPGALRSGVQTAGECSNASRGVGTFRADGTRIDTSLFTRDGIEPYVLPGIIAVVAGVVLVIGATTLVARSRRPRLTIDGKPIEGRAAREQPNRSAP